MKNKKRYIVLTVQLLIAAVLVFMDLWFKELAVTCLKDKPDVVFIKGMFAFSYAENTGAAFSAFSNSTSLLSVFTGILLAGILVLLILNKIQGKFMNVCMVMIFAGGLGNLIDRLRQGYVVDYIKTLFVDFPIYNFADILVVCGAVAVCCYLIYDTIKDEKKKKAEKAAEENGNS